MRTATTQLLVERRGVRVRKLINDEASGTRDAQGPESLNESMHAVKDEYSRSLVISRDVQNACSVRIEVEKLPSAGSRFELTGI